ncbi:hypothetical protein ABZV93_24965 [Actinopolymorpha sp. NPDC004070]|uniref:hypothetical protein n=1 Tax=Actinopolymorpha sp. NPDC004070 TaxID=3154548 RepID=UPI0033AF3C54
MTGLPEVPAKRIGATASWKSHWPSSAAVVAPGAQDSRTSFVVEDGEVDELRDGGLVGPDVDWQVAPRTMAGSVL